MTKGVTQQGEPSSRDDASHGDGASVHYRAGWGGFSLARPRPYTEPGGYFWGNPRPTPIRGPPILIPWTGPHLLLLIFNGDRSRV